MAQLREFPPSDGPDDTANVRLSARSSARRDAVLAGLRELFLAEGFADVTIAGLAQRLRCSRTTLYLVAASKEQIVVAVVRSFFKEAAADVEMRMASAPDSDDRLTVYLDAVAAALQPASAAFHADIAAFPPAREVYRLNTQLAAERVCTLIEQGVVSGALRDVDARFVAAAISELMTAVQRGSIGAATGLSDAACYRLMADLVVRGLSRT